MIQPKMKAILFDVDDTLLSFSGYVKQTMKEGFKAFGLKEYDDSMYPIFKRINDGLWKQIEQGTLTFEELMKIRWNRIFAELGISYDGVVFEKYFREQLFHSAIVEDGAMDLVEELRGKYLLCVASNGPFEQQKNRLQISKLYDCFQYFFVSERIGAQKPSKEFFDYCIRELNENSREKILPEEIMIVGDSASADIIGGKQYGLQTCLYIGNRTQTEEVPEADYTVKHLSEIKQIL